MPDDVLTPSPPVRCIVSEWRAKAGHEDEVAGILDRHAMLTRAELGVLTFIAHRSPEDRAIFLIYQQFIDQAALREHEATPHYQELVLQRVLPLLEKRERRVFDLLRV